MEAPRQPHAVILASPCMGHLIPLLELAKRLVADHGFRATFFQVTTPETSPERTQLLRLAAAASPYPNLLRIVKLPPVDISLLLPSDASPGTKVVVMMRESCVDFRSSVTAAEAPPPTVIVADFIGFDAAKVAGELHVPFYFFLPTSAWYFVLTGYIPTLDKEVEGEYVSQTAPIPLPGCKSLRPEDVAGLMVDRSDQQYREYVRLGESLSEADGILLNTWEGLEPSTLRALEYDEVLRRVLQVPVYPVGPLIRPVETTGSKSEVLEWLDRQPTVSVIFAAFGSFGKLTVEQMEEMAWGLERSGQRFVWVVRAS